MKRFFALFLALVMVLGMFPTSMIHVHAEEEDGVILAKEELAFVEEIIEEETTAQPIGNVESETEIVQAESDIDETAQESIVIEEIEISHEPMNASYQIVMTADEFVNCLKIAMARENVYNNQYPYNVGYYNGSVISFDCWNLGKSIIWTKGAIVNNYTKGNYAKKDTVSGLGDWTGLTIIKTAPNCSSDFSNLVPGEWLYLDGHTGYYIGDGQVIECTKSWGVNCITQSQIDSNGNRSRNGVSGGKWLYRGKVPWLEYCKHTNYIDEGICEDCGFEFQWTLNTNDAGIYVALKDFKPRSRSPYKAGPLDDNKTFKKGTAVTVTGSIINAHTNKWYQISYDGKIGYISESYIAKCDHSYKSKTTDATCEDDGKKTYTCKNCGHSYSEVIKATGHNLETEVTKAATCEKQGMETVTCTKCGYGYCQNIPATGHNLKTKVTTAATCEKNGMETVSCTKCDYGYCQDIPATGHNYESKVTTAATCTKKGVKTFTCKNCGKGYCEDIPKTDHSYTSKITTAATCTTKGVRTYTCGNCSASYTESIAATGSHSYGDWTTVTNADCMHNGIKKRSCTVCGAEETGDIPKTGHSYTDKVTTAATCDKKGIRTFTCSVCNDSYTEEIAVTGHEYTAKVIPGTCTEYEKTRYTCSICGDTYEKTSAPTMSEWSSAKPEGVDESLIETKTQYRYRTKSYTTSSNSSMDGWTQYNTSTQWSDYGSWSSWGDSAITASDSKQVETRKVYGYYYFRCGNCGAHMHGYGTCWTWAGGCGAATNNSGWTEIWSTTSWNDANLKDWHGTSKYYTYIDGELVFKWNEGGSKNQYRSRTRELQTLYHFYQWSDWSEWSDAKVSATDEREVETRTVYRYAVPKQGAHSYTEKVTAPTCTENGYTTYTCSACGDSYKDNYVDATGHAEVKLPGKVATCTEDGLTDGKKCSVCGVVTVQQETIKAKGHTEITVSGKAATCTEDGLTDGKKCSICGTVTVQQETIKAKGHTEATVSGKAATCTEDGLTDGKKCSVCGIVTVKQEVIKAAGHKEEVRNTKEATCEEDGYTGDIYCSVCDGKLRSGAAIPGGHIYAAVTTEPTCLTEGYTTHTCDRCGDSYVDTIVAALGHDYTVQTVAPTYTKPGYAEYTCTRCGDSYQDSFTDALGLPVPAVTVANDPVTGGALLTWEAIEGADSYEVYRATSSKGKYTLVETVTDAEAVVSVAVGKTHYFKVKAICAADAELNSAFSKVAKATGKCAQPEITTEVKASTGKPVIKWSKVTSAKKYTVYRATSENGKYTSLKTVTSTSYTDTSAKLGTTYYYKVKALGSKSTYNSADSVIKTGAAVCAQPVLTVKIDAATGKAALSWKKITGAASYDIYRATAADGEFEKIANQAEVSYKDLDAAANTDYWYKVQAIAEDEALNSADSAVKKAHTTLAKPVVTFAVDDASGKPMLTWEEVEGAVEYQVYRSTKSTSSYKKVNTTTDLTYTDTSVGVAKGYYYKVIAVGENVKSAYSAYKKLTAKCAQPVVTLDVNDNGQPVLKWEKIAGAKKYTIYRTDETGEEVSLGTTTKLTYTDKKAAEGATYTYRVRANGSKSTYNSTYSEPVSCAFDATKPVLNTKLLDLGGKNLAEISAVLGEYTQVENYYWFDQGNVAYVFTYGEDMGSNYIQGSLKCVLDHCPETVSEKQLKNYFPGGETVYDAMNDFDCFAWDYRNCTLVILPDSNGKYTADSIIYYNCDMLVPIPPAAGEWGSTDGNNKAAVTVTGITDTELVCAFLYEQMNAPYRINETEIVTLTSQDGVTYTASGVQDSWENVWNVTVTIQTRSAVVTWECTQVGPMANFSFSDFTVFW